MKSNKSIIITLILIFVILLSGMGVCYKLFQGVAGEIDSLETEISQLKSPAAVFSTSSNDALRVDKFSVCLEDVRKYADGYILTFDIGNPLFITYENIKVELRWGKSRSEGMKFEDWKKSLLEKTQIVKKEILPGTWNKIEIRVSPAKEEDLSFIRMKISSDRATLSLKKDHRANME